MLSRSRTHVCRLSHSGQSIPPKLLFWTVCVKWSLLLFRSVSGWTSTTARKTFLLLFYPHAYAVRVVSKCTSPLHPRQHFNKHDITTNKIDHSKFLISSQRWCTTSYYLVINISDFSIEYGDWSGRSAFSTFTNNIWLHSMRRQSMMIVIIIGREDTLNRNKAVSFMICWWRSE